MSSQKDLFDVSGPSYLTYVNWNCPHHRRSVMASLVQGVYVLERDWQWNRKGPDARAPAWWRFFHFELRQAPSSPSVAPSPRSTRRSGTSSSTSSWSATGSSTSPASAPACRRSATPWRRPRGSTAASGWRATRWVPPSRRWAPRPWPGRAPCCPRSSSTRRSCQRRWSGSGTGG